MSEHEATVNVTAPSSAVFAVAADVRRLPEWLPTVEQSRTLPDGEVHVEGDARSGHYESEGFWRPSPDQLRVEWGTPSRGGEGGGYAGWLQVHDRADGGSDVTAHLSFFEQDAPSSVDEDLERSLEALARRV